MTDTARLVSRCWQALWNASLDGWTAPHEVGMYDVAVVVKDGDRDSAMDSLHISVATEQPPPIETMLIIKDRYGHCYLKKSSEKYPVGKEQEYDIECIVSNASMELSYEWSCTGGELSGEGPLVTLTAPNTIVELTVMAIVCDIAGNMFSKNIILSVVSCSHCTFGCQEPNGDSSSGHSPPIPICSRSNS